MFVLSLLCVTCDHSSFAIILKKTRSLVALLLLSYYRCRVTLNVLWLFLTVPTVGLQCVIVVFPDYTTVVPTKSDSDVILCLQLLCKTLTCTLQLR